MFNLNHQPIFRYKSRVYICKRLGTIQDEDMNEIEVFDKPVRYSFNVQPAKEDSEGREFGQTINSLRVAVIPKNKYKGKFKEYDKVYIDNEPSKDEIDYGDNADYRIYSIRPQNACIRIYFIKLVKNSMIGE